MPDFFQPTLSGGELSPGLQGRVDLVRYATSVKQCRNVITKHTGGAVKRTGWKFLGRVKHRDRPTRLLPFIYSTETAYLVEMGDGYFRFWANDVLVTNSTKAITGISQAATAVVTAIAHGFSDGQHVVIENVYGMDWINGRSYQVANATADTFELAGLDSSALAAYTGGGAASRVVEVVTPYTGTLIHDVRFTQSADILYLVHQDIPPQELRRTAADAFELVAFAFRRGPFRTFNPDEAAIMAVSGAQGNVTVTTNVDVFTPEMVGSLLYMEEKELRGVKPWVAAEKNPALGAQRRSDGKIYRASSVPVVSSPNYYVCGNVRPIHDVGRAFDGPQDIKDDGVNDYVVGVEWEFVSNGFGIVQITEYVDAMEVKAVVIETVPDSIVGTAPTPVGGPWTFSGNSVLTDFSILGATSANVLNYKVTINGVPIQPNPFYTGGGGIGGIGGGGSGIGRPGFNDTQAVQ